MSEFYRNRLNAFGLKQASFSFYPAVEKPELLSKDQMPVVLKNLSIQVRKGEFVAFTGQSGCGKSTALKLLMCVFQPDSGERYYLDTAGNRNPLSADWRRLFAYVPQGNRIFSGTVREALTFGDGDVADEEIWRALDVAAADFVRELPEGLETKLGERGAGLSEGQLQRLAIARAVLSGHPILLLDEATSALDEGTEARLLDNLKRMTDRTVLIVTHRPRVREISDRVWEVE